MRMWMVDPHVMCRKHLLGEHVELHMLVGHLERRRAIGGYVITNCVEPRAIESRHAALMTEMARRGYWHASQLVQPDVTWLPTAHRRARVDRAAALKELLRRCPECHKAMKMKAKI